MRKETMAERAYQIIKNEIIFGEMKLGEEIDQKMLAKSLGYNSVTPIRESLIQLQKEKLVKILPRRGIYVADVSIEDVMENYQLREIIEPTVFSATAMLLPAGTIAKYCEMFSKYKSDQKVNEFNLKEYLQNDMDFHLDLLRPLGNKSLDSILRGLYEQNTRYRMACIRMREANDMLDEHIAILSALEQKDTTTAVEALKTHITNSKSAFLPNNNIRFI